MLSRIFPSIDRNTNLLPDWSALPSDLLEEISRVLVSWDDYVGFRSVCTSWRSATSKRPYVPLLIIIGYYIELCNFPEPEFYCPPKLPIGTSQGKRICGSSHGWIFMQDTAPDDNICMCNPFNGVLIALPALPDLKLAFKMILSSNPVLESENCTIVNWCDDNAIWYCRLGDASWSLALYQESGVRINDAAFYKGKLFTVVNSYRIFSCQVGTGNSMFTEILPADQLFQNRQVKQWHLPIKPIHPWRLPLEFINPDTDTDDPRQYFCGIYDALEDEVNKFSCLAVSSGELWLVDITKINDKVSSCDVFQVDFNDGMLRLMMLENLGGRALFLGERATSFCISVDTSFPLWCRRNCIYYAEAGVMTIVLNLEDRSISYMTDVLVSSKMWLTPSLL